MSNPQDKARQLSRVPLTIRLRKYKSERAAQGEPCTAADLHAYVDSLGYKGMYLLDVAGAVEQQIDAVVQLVAGEEEDDLDA